MRSVVRCVPDRWLQNSRRSGRRVGYTTGPMCFVTVWIICVVKPTEPVVYARGSESKLYPAANRLRYFGWILDGEYLEPRCASSRDAGFGVLDHQRRFGVQLARRHQVRIGQWLEAASFPSADQ